MAQSTGATWWAFCATHSTWWTRSTRLGLPPRKHTCNPSTQCRGPGQQPARMRLTGEKGDTELHGPLLSSLKHDRKAMTGGWAWPLGAGEEPPQWPGDGRSFPWLRTCELGAQESWGCSRLDKVLRVLDTCDHIQTEWILSQKQLAHTGKPPQQD